MSSPLITCQSISKSYGSRFLFKDLSFSIFEGDQIGLIGPNGAGKTTLLKILSGIESANSGDISMRKGLKIGYVPQECEFEDVLPVEVLIDQIQEDLPDYEKERLAETWLSRVGIKETEKSALLIVTVPAVSATCRSGIAAGFIPGAGGTGKARGNCSQATSWPLAAQLVSAGS